MVDGIPLNDRGARIASKPTATGFLAKTPELIRPTRPVTPLSHRSALLKNLYDLAQRPFTPSLETRAARAGRQHRPIAEHCLRLLLTIGLLHWHREQLAITQQMEKRERVFREHRLFDKLTPLGGADYLKRQVNDCLTHSV